MGIFLSFSTGIVEISTLPRNKCVEIVSWLYGSIAVLWLAVLVLCRRGWRAHRIFYCLLSSNLNTEYEAKKGKEVFSFLSLFLSKWVEYSDTQALQKAQGCAKGYES